MKFLPYLQATLKLTPFLACIAFGGRVFAQDGTQWITLKPIKTWAELDFEDQLNSESAGGTHVTSESLYLAPLLGADIGGAIYHPNLLQFNFKGQGGYIYQETSLNANGNDSSWHQTSYLQNYDASVLLLAEKPYAATFNADQEHTFQQLDTFNEVTLDSKSYGGHLGYNEGPVPFNITLKHLEYDETGMQYNNDFSQDDLELNAQNTRAQGTTSFNYDLGQYNQQTAGYSQNQFYQYGTLFDSEKFWDQKAILSSSAYFSQQSSTNLSADNATLQENLTLKHSPSWSSFYNYNFNDTYFAPTEATAHYGMIGIQNQLFQSLSSELNVHGTLQNSSGGGSSFSSSSYGIGNVETYNKRLGDWGHLTVGNSAQYDITHEQNMGSAATIANEQHVLTDGKTTFLSQPRVIAVSLVTGPNGTPIYHQGIDYQVIPLGDLTQIERIPTSLTLTNGSTVLINYTVQSQPSGSYSTFNDQVQVRLDMFNGLLSVYTGIGWLDNSSAEEFVLENSFTTQSGVDFSWRWLRAGAVYQTESGNLISYSTLGTYQTASFQPSTTSTVTLNGREQWSRYPSENLSIDDYTFDTRFTEHFGQSFDLTLQAGVWNESGGPLQETLLTAGLQARYTIGKLFLNLAYQFNQQDVSNGKNLGNFVSFSLRRNF